VHVGKWRVESLRLVPKHTCGSIRRLGLRMSVEVSMQAVCPYHRVHALVEGHGAVLANAVENALNIGEERLHWGTGKRLIHN
jgi:hypothetical protein